MKKSLKFIITEIKKAEEINEKNKNENRKTNPKLNKLIKYSREIYRTIGDYDSLLFFIEPKGRNHISYEKEFALFLKKSKKDPEYCPIFTYPEIEKLDIKDIDNVILKLSKIGENAKKECADNNITEIVFELLEIAGAKVNFLKELKVGNLKTAFKYSKIVYGDIDKKLCKSAVEAHKKNIKFLKNKPEKSELERTLEKNKFNAQEIKKYFELALAKTELKHSGYKVIVSDNVSSIKISDNDPGYDFPVILIPSEIKVTKIRLLQLIAHEIGRHLTANFYHKKQGFVSGIGRGWNIFNEGMAKKSEVEIKKVMLGSLYADSEIDFSIYYVLAMERIKDGWNFAKVYKHIFELDYKEKLFENRYYKFKNKSAKHSCKIKSEKEAVEIAKKICLRVFRGFDPREGYMYFPKDKIYFEGKIKISELEKIRSGEKLDKYLHLSKADPKFIPFLIEIGTYTYEKNWEKAKNIATQIWKDHREKFINKKISNKLKRLMCKNIFNGINSLSTVLLVKEALERGIKVSHINNYQKEMTFLELFYKKHFEYIAAQSSSMTSYAAYYAEKNKMLTKSLLSRAKINVPKGKLFHKNKIGEVYKFIKEVGYPIVIKPFDGAHGDLVFIGLKNKKDCDEAIKKIIKKSRYILVEKEFKGIEFRFVASRDKVFAATNREPANIVGNGVYNIKKLIKVKNSDSKRGEDYGSPLVKIKIDEIMKQNLFKQGINVNYIPNKGEKIYLRKESNISTGGDSIDVTDIVHPELKKIAIRAIRAIPGLAYAGVDIMTNKDISKKPTKKSYVILEINSSPGIDIHHFPYQGKPRNVAKEIIDILFPETKGRYVKYHKEFMKKDITGSKDLEKYFTDQKIVR